MDRRSWFARVSVVFAAGVLGGFTNSLAVWGAGGIGLTGILGVQIAPTLSAGWLYPRLVWGGLWGFLFLVPFLQRPLWLRGLFYSLGPTLVQCLVVFPTQTPAGFFGLERGVLTPVFVVLFNAVWGWTAVAWIQATRRPAGVTA